MMTRARPWAIAAAAFAALVAAACLAVAALVPTDEQLARRVEAEFEARLGQKLVVGAVHWRILGLPMVEVLDAYTVQPEAIRVHRAAVYPQLLPLLQKRVVIDRLQVEGAVVPRNSMAAFRGKTQEDQSAVTLRAVQFRDLTYISYSGIPVVYEGEIDFDDDRLPHRLQIRRPDVKPPVSLDAARDGKTAGGADLYQLRLQGAGGSARGQVQLATSPEGRMRLTGELAPRSVEVQSLLQAFNRRSPISGYASGQTSLTAEGDTPGELVRSLHTRSVLNVERARILRIDVDKAIKSLGKDRAGETPLDSLAGVMETQNTEHGLKTAFTEVKAVAGKYAATGQATLYRKQIDAEGKLDIGGGIVGVPFSAHGPTSKPDFKIATGFIAGAAIGTVLLPGIGTVIGANIGGAMSGPPKAKAAKAPAPASAKPAPVSPRLR